MSVSGCLALIIVLEAVEMDLRIQKISNKWLLIGWILGLIYQCTDPAGAGPLAFAAGSAVPILILGIFFYFRMLGAGDLKLLAVLGGIMGPAASFGCVFWSVIFGAMFSVMILSVCGDWLHRFLYFTNYMKNYFNTGSRIPYRRQGNRKEHLHFSVPVLMGVLLWIGGFY